MAEAELTIAKLPAAALENMAASGALYAVVDACDVPAVPYKAREMKEEQAVCLYKGSAEEDYWSFAPYLMCVDIEMLAWIRGSIWTESWGIFALCEEGIETLYDHFRRFLLVEDPQGEEMYFRFYDPRVLPKFLEACSLAERLDIFGPIEAFGILGPHGVSLIDAPVKKDYTISNRRKGLFKIRNPHMAAFTAEAEQAFQRQLTQNVLALHPQHVAGLSYDILSFMVTTGMSLGRRYGFQSEADLTTFIAIMFAIAPNFDQHPYIRNILTDVRMPPETKLDSLIHNLPERAWNEAKRAYDVAAWGVPPGAIKDA